MAATDTQGTRLLAARVLAAQLAAQAAQLAALAERGGNAAPDYPPTNLAFWQWHAVAAAARKAHREAEAASQALTSMSAAATSGDGRHPT